MPRKLRDLMPDAADFFFALLPQAFSVPVTFEPSPEYDHFLELYACYAAAARAVPFDAGACNDAYEAWETAAQEMGLACCDIPFWELC